MSCPPAGRRPTSCSSSVVEATHSSCAGWPDPVRAPISRACGEYSGPRSGVPIVLQQVLRSVLDGTGVDEVTTSTAAAIGAEFDAALLAAVLDRPQERVDEDLRVLAAYEVIRRLPTPVPVGSGSAMGWSVTSPTTSSYTTSSSDAMLASPTRSKRGSRRMTH